MKKALLTILPAAILLSLGQAQAYLLLSQYVEGSSNNKAIEIANNSSSAYTFGLGDQLQFFFNGNTTAGTTIALNSGTTLNPGQTWVVADNNSNAAILAVTDQQSTSSFFNGDDFIGLYTGGSLTDSIGQLGTDPGSQWGSGTLSTANNTIGLSSLPAPNTGGDANSGDAADLSRFVGAAQDDITGLGDDFSSGPPPPPPPAPSLPVVINEFVSNHTGSDSTEFVEILGGANYDYSSLTLLQIEGDNTGAGTIDSVFGIGTTDANGFWTTGFLSNEFENGTASFLLVEGFTGSDGQDLDTNNDGIFDVMPWGSILDSIGVSDGGGSDWTYGGTSLVGGYDGIGFPPGGAARVGDLRDTNSPGDWRRLDFGALSAFGTPSNLYSTPSGALLPTPGGFNVAPEPSRALLLGLGLLALVARRRR